jgi:chaperonin GroES
MKFRPLHDRVVIERIDAEAKTAGGIIIPDTAQEKPQQGKVIAVGPGGRDESGKLIPIDVKVGDRILFGKWSGTEVKIDGVEYLIMKESDIMGVLVEAEAPGGNHEADPFDGRENIGSIILIVGTRPTVVPPDEVKQKGILRCLPRK